MKRFILTFFFVAWGSVGSLAAYVSHVVEFVADGPIHEALITQELGSTILRAAPHRPPADLIEYIPDRKGVKGQWIHGYWSWSENRADFIWVSGLWRKTPPDQRWIHGKWVQLEEGWVWLKGFWSPTFEGDLQYLSKAPPDLIEESVSRNMAKNYFWIPGLWQFDKTVQDYVWVQGKWYPLESKWQYVPAHYEWREKGYVFVPSYWDYPLEERGMAYASIYLEPEKRSTMIYTPSMVLEPLFIAEALYPQWPNYPCFFQHHFHFHYDIWLAWGAVPPWWHWNHWWTYSWQNHWWLWWWWSHPGYPASPFVDKAVALQLTKPPQFVLDLMKNSSPNPVVLGTAVIGSETLTEAIARVTGHESPILPADSNMVKQIFDAACCKKAMATKLRPAAPSIVLQEPEKPVVEEAGVKLKYPPITAQVPPHPTSPAHKKEPSPAPTPARAPQPPVQKTKPTPPGVAPDAKKKN